jgi:hypothetical protein
VKKARTQMLAETQVYGNLPEGFGSARPDQATPDQSPIQQNPR